MTTACPSAASVGASTIASTSASGQVSSPKSTSGDDRARDDRQRQPDAEQPRRQRDLAPQRPEVDPRRVGEEHERQRRLGERTHGAALDPRVEPAQEPRSRTTSPAPTNSIGAVRTVRSSRRDTPAYPSTKAAMIARLQLSMRDFYRGAVSGPTIRSRLTLAKSM